MNAFNKIYSYWLNWIFYFYIIEIIAKAYFKRSNFFFFLKYLFKFIKLICIIPFTKLKIKYNKVKK